jgi:hypothetical protein
MDIHISDRLVGMLGVCLVDCVVLKADESGRDVEASLVATKRPMASLGLCRHM